MILNDRLYELFADKGQKIEVELLSLGQLQMAG